MSYFIGGAIFGAVVALFGVMVGVALSISKKEKN